MYNHALHHSRKYFCSYYLLAFTIKEILKHHIEDYNSLKMANMLNS